MDIRRLTKDSTPYLSKKHDARRNFEVLAYLEICRKGDGSVYNVMTPHGKLVMPIQFRQEILLGVQLTYKFATGRPGLIAPATICINWDVKTPLPIRAKRRVEKGCTYRMSVDGFDLFSLWNNTHSDKCA